jgi:hypothetical protein
MMLTTSIASCNPSTISWLSAAKATHCTAAYVHQCDIALQETVGYQNCGSCIECVHALTSGQGSVAVQPSHTRLATWLGGGGLSDNFWVISLDCYQHVNSEPFGVRVPGTQRIS